MTKTDVAYPKKSRDLHNMLMDSTRWDGFKFRDDDIVIDTWAKSGTTWTQQIVSQLIFNGAEDLPAMDLAPWLDLLFLARDGRDVILRRNLGPPLEPPSIDVQLALYHSTRRSQISKHRLIAASSRAICQPTRWIFHPKPSICSSPGTVETSSGVGTSTSCI